MNNRLKQFIQYKTRGRQVDFAEQLGWSASYLAKLLKGINFGLQPVLAILEKFPEIDARWLLLGEGEMLSEMKQAELRREAFSYIHEVLELEKFLPLMSPKELHKYEQAVIARQKPDFSPDLIRSWEKQLSQREQEINAKFTPFTHSKTEKKCNRPTAKK